MNFLKRVRINNSYTGWMLVIVAVATLLRLVLIYFHWPATDSDEGNMGLLALHVAFQGDHPIFFYGAPYMAPLEGYAAAPLFRLFGVSLFALRLPLVLCTTGFLVSMYYLVRLLYQSEKFALASVILLALGSPDVLFLQLRASGEYPELEFMAALMCLLALWLALTSYASGQRVGWRMRWKRIIIYSLLGLVVGLALWDDLLILPFVVSIVVLLCLFCRRELLGWPGLTLLLGIVAGAFPMIYYNLTAPSSQNSWLELQRLDSSGAAVMLAQHLSWLNQLSGTMLIALPQATGGSLRCPISPVGTPPLSAIPCVLFQGGWGIGYLVLCCIAAAVALHAIWRSRLRVNREISVEASPGGRPLVQDGPTIASTLSAGGRPGLASTNIHSFNSRQNSSETIRQCARLMLLTSVGLTLLLYAISPSPATVPATSFRYLACLLLVIPVLLWPLSQGLRINNISNWSRRRKMGLLFRGGVLLLVAATFVSGTIRTFLEIPDAQETYQAQQAIVQDLLRIGATRVYSDYGTCNVLTFLSNERIICSALASDLRPGNDRYLPYRYIVRAAPHPTYIFPIGIPQAQAIKQRVANLRYRYYTFEGYIVYQVT